MKNLQVEITSENPNKLKAHPRNYRSHPEDQIKHIIQSITEHGFYRNVVIANDGTILAGHGVVKACIQMGLNKIPVRRLNIKPDSIQALKILAGDNEISRMAEVDDRQLTDVLKEIKDLDVNQLLGTGFDNNMLINLLMVTRPSSEIQNVNEAAQWAGMPEFEIPDDDKVRIVISFDNEEIRDQFIEKFKLAIDTRGKKIWSTRWPFTPRKDTSSVAFKMEGQPQ